MADDVSTRLYLVTPRLASASRLLPGLAAALEAGDVACLLLRLESMAERAAKDIVKIVAPLVQERDVALLVEDPRLAAHTGADGVHVPAVGEDFAAAIESMHPDRIVGVGGLVDRDVAMEAGERGADYLMFGDEADDIWSAEATLERVAWWVEIFNVPCVGLVRTIDEVEALARVKTEFIGLGAELWQDPRGIAAAVRDAAEIVARVAAEPKVSARSR